MPRKQILAATLAILLASGAQASSSVTVDISNLNVSSTGAFAWLDMGQSFTAMAQDQTSLTPTWSAWSASSSYGSGATVTTVAGTSVSAGLSSNGYSFQLSTPATGGIALAGLDLWGSYSLAAHSSVTISMNISAFGLNNGQSAAAMLVPNGMVLNVSGQMGNQWQGMTPVYAVQSSENPTAAFSFSSVGPQSFTFTNTTDAMVTSDFRGSVEVYSRGAVAAAVPEPESYALALAGLGIVGLRMTRRRS